MSESTKRSTVYFMPDLHRAFCMKAADTQRTVSDLVNDAVCMALREGQEDLAALVDRQAEPVMTYEELLRDLKACGKI